MSKDIYQDDFSIESKNYVIIAQYMEERRRQEERERKEQIYENVAFFSVSFVMTSITLYLIFSLIKIFIQ